MSIKAQSLAVYKHKAVIVKEIADKIVIESGTESFRVREKDIIPIYEGPVKDFKELEGAFADSLAQEIWELASGEAENLKLKDIAELAGGWTAKNAWYAYLLLVDGLYFEGSPDAVRAKSPEIVEAERQKRRSKDEEQAQRGAFLERLKSKKLDLPADMRFLQDVEALAFGKSDKSRTMKDCALEESSEAAHRLLLETKVWDNFVNPHPARFGLSLCPPRSKICHANEDEKRVDLTGLAAFAIDDEGSLDPDDAISLEAASDGLYLYVHVADPSSAILPESEADREARERGATLYLPEGAVRMLCEDALKLFALGLSETSAALSFKMKIDPEGKIEKQEIFRSIVRVERLTYKDAVQEPRLKALFELSNAAFRRRLASQAVEINLPEVNISVMDGKVDVKMQENYPSRLLVRESMLLAGFAAASWALERKLCFPFVSQEASDNEGPVPESYAGAYQLRRRMKQRTLSTKPGMHYGLGLDIYAQVTSPLRRYTDLLAHEQISAHLRGEKAIDEEAFTQRLAVSEMANLAVRRAERASRAHWMAVYLSAKIGSKWEGVILEQRGAQVLILIPELALEIQTAIHSGANLEPNEKCLVQLSSVNIPKTESRWLLL